MRASKRTTEAAIVQRIEEAAASRGNADRGAGLVLAMGDDAALWRPRSGFETILTTDWFLEGTHFWRDWHPAESIGWKCVTRAASDIAAMGGLPRCFLLSLALPPQCTGQWLNGFLRGLKRASAKLRCPLAGGDTTRADKILINVTVVGEAPGGTALRRSGAKPGDQLFVSGRLGEAELGLRLARRLRRSGRRFAGKLIEKHLFPEARIALGDWLRRSGIASASMDLSDGLSLDLHRLCLASGVGALLEAETLPTAAQKFASSFNAPECVAAALHGGDDYELLFCVTKKHHGRIPASKFGVKLTRIGEITDDSQITLTAGSGRKKRLTPGGWDPF